MMPESEGGSTKGAPSYEHAATPYESPIDVARGGDSPDPKGPRTVRLLWGRRGIARLALLFAFGAATVSAVLQSPRDPHAVEASLLDGLRYPIERNPQLRLPPFPVPLSGVFFLEGGRTGWVVGARGFIGKTDDGGITWNRQHIGEARTRSVDASDLGSLLISNAYAGAPPDKEPVAQSKEPAADTAAQRQVPRPPPEQAQQTTLPPVATRPLGGSKSRGGGVKALPAPLVTSGASAESGKPNLPPAVEVDPSSANLTAVYFIDDRHGAVVGEGGTVLLTEDGGQVWLKRAGGASETLRAVSFADTQHGAAVGDGGLVLVTDDAGQTWHVQASGTTAPLRSISFSDAQHGVVVGLGVELRIEDGWAARPAASLRSVNFAGPRRPGASGNGSAVPLIEQAVAVGNGGSILSSADGQSWQTRPSPTKQSLASVQFTDARRGVAVGDSGTVLLTEDGGRSWTPRASGTKEPLSSVHFSDDRHGAVVGEGGTVLVTEDGGQTWQERTSGLVKRWMSVYAADAGHVVAVGSDGAVQVSQDGGESWLPVDSHVFETLWSAHFVDARHGVAVGGDGTILIADAAGFRWQARPSGTDARLQGVYVGVTRHGVAVGQQGTILFTADAGQSWHSVDSGTSQSLASVSFGDDQRGVAVGSVGTVLSTEDGGTSWQPRASGSKAGLHGVNFSDARHAVAVGSDGAVLRTEDGGQSWQRARSGTTESLDCVYLTDARNGVAVGTHGTVLRTLDAGQSWIAGTSGTTASLRSVYMSDGLHGVAVGDGVQLRTQDGGKSWRAAAYGRWPAPWYWLSCAGLLALLWPIGRIVEPELREQAPQRTVADEYASDRPARSPEEDRLRFGPRVDGLSRYLRNLKTDPPLTMAITGPWGSGKSSFMRLLQEDLERHGGSTVWFNAWHHQKEEHLHAALLEAVRQQAVPSAFSPPGIIFRVRLFWERTKASLGLALLGVVLVAMSATYLFMRPDNGAPTQGEELWQAVSCIADPPKTPSEADKLAAAVDRFTEATEQHTLSKSAPPVQAKPLKTPEEFACEQVLGSKPAEGWFSAAWRLLLHGKVGQGLIVLMLGLLPIFKALMGLRAFGMDPAVLKSTLSGQGNLKALSQETSFRYRFAMEFETVGEALRPAVLTIFIDDLDRCSEQQVMELLEAVNYLVESGRCFVVLGMVEETVERLVGLAFERVAAELAEQQPRAGKPVESTEDMKRAQRKRFAEQYLEKLINLRVEVPVLDEHAARYLITAQTQDAEADKIELPRWVGWVDPPLTWLWKARLAIAIVAAGSVAASLGEILAQGDAQRAPVAVTAPAAAPASSVAVPVAPTSAPAAAGAERPRSEVPRATLPEHLAPAQPGSSWLDKSAQGVIAFVLLAALIGAIARRPEYHTHDSPAFIRAFEIWTPLVIAKVKTARGLKRYRNRVRFLAMALDAQANRAPQVPVTVGPVGRWLVEVELARREAQSRFNALLPEPILVAMTALNVVEARWDDGRVRVDPTFSELLDQAARKHNQEVHKAKGWPPDCLWPPDKQAREQFGEVLGSLPAQSPPASPQPARKPATV